MTHVGDHTAAALRRAAQLIADADALLITAGAGMSADSGLPVYRDNDGFWRAYPPLQHLGLSFEHMAQPHWFDHKPRMAWAFYGHRQQLYRETPPHPGYELLRRWVERMSVGSFVVTSNVDGQFVDAGFARERIVEQHGSIHRLQCSRPCCDDLWDAAATHLDIDLATLDARAALPRCPKCGAVARPNILMFDDDRWIADATRAQTQAFEAWFAGARGRQMVVLELGAGTALPTIRRLSERAAQRPRASLVRINPEALDADDGSITIRLRALEALTQLAAALPDRFVNRAPVEIMRPAVVRPPPVVDAILRPLPARAMETIEFTTPSRPARHRRPPPAELAPITYVELRTGEVNTIDPEILEPDEIAPLLAPWYESGNRRFVPLPAFRGLELPAYRLCGGVLRVDGSARPEVNGAALLTIAAPDDTRLLRLGFACRTVEGARLWRHLHEDASTPVLPLEYPAEPWIVLLLEPGASRHAALLGPLLEIGRAIGIAWLRCQAVLEDDAED